MVPVAAGDGACKLARARFSVVFFEAGLVGVVDPVGIDPTPRAYGHRVVQFSRLRHLSVRVFNSLITMRYAFFLE
jgi:hypothetical protein